VVSVAKTAETTRRIEKNQEEMSHVETGLVATDLMTGMVTGMVTERIDQVRWIPGKASLGTSEGTTETETEETIEEMIEEMIEETTEEMTDVMRDQENNIVMVMVAPEIATSPKLNQGTLVQKVVIASKKDNFQKAQHRHNIMITAGQGLLLVKGLQKTHCLRVQSV
jgi:hypothetical protein